jgi:hypothetical protein
MRSDSYFARKEACFLFDTDAAYVEKRAVLSEIRFEAFGTGVPPQLVDRYPDWQAHVARRRDAVAHAQRERRKLCKNARITDPRLPSGK